jgi:hypothetical protein
MTTAGLDLAKPSEREMRWPCPFASLPAPLAASADVFRPLGHAAVVPARGRAVSVEGAIYLSRREPRDERAMDADGKTFSSVSASSNELRKPCR